MTHHLLAALALSAALPAVLSTTASPAFAQAALPLPAAADTPYPGGTMRLDIDATDVTRGIYRVTQTIPVAAGTRELTLLFPLWLPGNHGPRGPVAELADLRFTVGGKPVAWRRDPVEVNAFRVTLPAGAREVEARFIHTSPLQASEGRITMTREMLNLQWEKMSLYPAGHHVRRIRVRPTVTMPAGWTPAVALDGQTKSGDRYAWAETNYEQLVDSPIFAGANFRKWDLGDKVTLNVVADTPDLLTLRQQDLAALSAMVDEAQLVFGQPAYDRYEFLLALSDRIGGIGLEHLRSSENQMEPKNFTQWDKFDFDRNVLPHEFAHSWNGKYRRPAGLATPDYQTPMQDELLWVYEGQTQFWGLVLAARSGVQKKETVLGALATAAGSLSISHGRDWRSLEDTTFDPVFAARKAKPYASLTRGEDYYWEGALIWLEVDQILRSGTRGAKGIDDFARAFFSHREGTGPVLAYTFDDVVATLNDVMPYDWAAFLRMRVEQPDQPAPVAGIEKAGYRLVWKPEPNPYDAARMENAHTLELWHSLGIQLDQDGAVSAVRWDSPAFDAGIVSGAKIVAVDSQAYSADAMRQAITRAKGGKTPMQLIVRRGDRFVTTALPYADGLRYPWLERTGTTEAPLDRLLAPRRSRATS